jgi:hypothetical protein
MVTDSGDLITNAARLFLLLIFDRCVPFTRFDRFLTSTPYHSKSEISSLSTFSSPDPCRTGHGHRRFPTRNLLSGILRATLHHTTLLPNEHETPIPAPNRINTSSIVRSIHYINVTFPSDVLPSSEAISPAQAATPSLSPRKQLRWTRIRPMYIPSSIRNIYLTQ